MGLYKIDIDRIIRRSEENVERRLSTAAADYESMVTIRNDLVPYVGPEAIEKLDARIRRLWWQRGRQHPGKRDVPRVVAK